MKTAHTGTAAADRIQKTQPCKQLFEATAVLTLGRTDDNGEKEPHVHNMQAAVHVDTNQKKVSEGRTGNPAHLHLNTLDFFLPC